MRLLRTLVALALPMVALAAHLTASALTRHVWFLFFYPAVFLSSWIGGLRRGLAATALATVLVMWFVIPPTSTFAKPAGVYFPVGVFVSMGVLFAAFHDRLHQTTLRALDAIAALHRANEAAARLVDQAPDGIFVADLDGRYTHVNRAGCRMLGYSREELVGKTIADLLPPEDLPRLARSKLQLLGGESHLGQWTLRAKDGTWIPVEVRAQILADGRWQAVVRDLGERQKLEAALRESHGDLVRAQAVAHVGSWRLDVRRDVLEWSDEEYRIFGVAPATPMTFETFLACVHPDDRAYVRTQWTAALRGQPYDIEHRLLVDGEVRWVREKADLAFDGERELIGGIGVTLDITDRKQREEELRRAEEAMRRAEARSSGILSISADALLSIDEAQRITMFNDGAEKIFGYAKAEVIGRPLDTLIPERLRAVHRRHVERFAAGAQTARRMGERGASIVGLRKNGEEFPADAAISKLEVGGDHILTVALRDITEQRRVEDEQRFLARLGEIATTSLDFAETLSLVARAAVEFMADFVVVDFVEGNGLRRAKVAAADPTLADVARAVERLPPGAHQPRWVRLAIESRQSQVVTFTEAILHTEFPEDAVRGAHAAMRPASVMFVPLIARDRVLGVMSFVRSEPGSVYGASDTWLAEEVALRAALAFENARLYQVAQEAIEARDDIMGIVAHDLRNPLNSIVLQASMLRDLDPRFRRQAGVIESSAHRMNRLIQDLLDVTRLEAGRLAIEQARVATADVVREAVETQQPMATSASLALQVELPPDVPDVWADRDRLLQVFENIIGNAVKFTAPGGRISIGARAREREVLFWVADTGPGIAAEHLPRLFERFWQARKGERRGAGLGLPIVKGIIEAHGGRIWVDSAPGQGATFLFTLPRAAAPGDARPVPAHADP